MSDGQHRGALPAEISWWVRWPVLTSPHPVEGMKSCSAVPAISLTAGNVFAAEPSELLGAGLVSTHKSWCPPHTGTPVLLCPCQCSSWQLWVYPRAPKFLQWVGYPEFPHCKGKKNWCCTPPGSRGAFYEGTNSTITHVPADRPLGGNNFPGCCIYWWLGLDWGSCLELNCQSPVCSSPL